MSQQQGSLFVIIVIKTQKWGVLWNKCCGNDKCVNARNVPLFRTRLLWWQWQVCWLH